MRTDDDAPALPIGAAATIIGVSRARVYQRVGQYHGWVPGKPLPSVPGATKRPGPTNSTHGKAQLLVQLSDVLAWRAEREAAGLAVGPLPDELAEHILPEPPPLPSPDVIGLPTFRPY